MLSFMTFMSVLIFSRSDFVRECEIGEVGVIGGEIASVSMEDEGPDHVFVKGDIVRNMYWLGLLVYLYIIDL